MSKTTKETTEAKVKDRYRLSNWATYNKSLVKRGNVTIWLSDDVKDSWYYDGPQKPGGEIRYSDVAIEFCLTMKHLYNLPYRQTEGYIVGLFELSGTDLDVPSYSQIQRRSGKIEIDIRVRKRSKENINVVIDSTGLKVYGEGEWKVRKYGYTKRRTWRKLHMASDGDDLEILEIELTENNIHDSEAGIEIMENIEESIGSCAGDGAFDTKKFRGCLPEEAEQLIPPQRNAVVSNGRVPEFEKRDEAIKRIEEVGRKEWKEETGYHIRSLSEVNMYRYKKIFGPELGARKAPFEKAEVSIKCKILNKFVGIGMPISYKVSA